MTDAADLDATTRTIVGEAGGEPLDGQRAVAHVIANRAMMSGQTPSQVVSAPHQFESWQSPRVQALQPSSPSYQRARAVAAAALSGQDDDPTGGATHFLNPTLQAAMGRTQPSWAPGGSGQQIGAHVFYKGDYGGGGGAEPTAAQIIAASQRGGGKAPASSSSDDDTPPTAAQIIAASGQPDPSSTPAPANAPPQATPGQTAAQKWAKSQAVPAGPQDAYLHSLTGNLLPTIDAGVMAAGTGIRNAFAGLTGGQKLPFGMGDAFDAVRSSESSALDKYTHDHPIVSTIANAAGYISPGGVVGGATHVAEHALAHVAPTLASSIGGRVVNHIAGGALGGAVAGAGSGISHGESAPDILKESLATGAEGGALGGVLGGVGETAPSILSGLKNPVLRKAVGMVAGGGIGALTTPSQPLVGGVAGAMAGGFGGEMLGPRARTMANAADQASAVDQIAAAHGGSHADAAAAFEGAHPAMTPPEVLGAPGSQLVQGMENASPGSVDPIRKIMASREESGADRVISSIHDATDIDPATAKMDAMQADQAARQANAPLWSEAIQDRGIHSPELAELQQHPRVAQALKAAETNLGPSAMVDNPDIKPPTPMRTALPDTLQPADYQAALKLNNGKTPSEDQILHVINQREGNGAPAAADGPARVYTDRAWDHARGVLSEGVDRDPFTNKPTSSKTNLAMAVQASKISSVMRQQVPGMSDALNASGDVLKNVAARDLGAKQYSSAGGKGALTSPEFSDRFGKLSDGEQQATRQGYLGELYKKLEGGKFNPDAFLKSDTHAGVMRTMFGPEAHAKIEGAMRQESQFGDNAAAYGRIKGAPQTAHGEPIAHALKGLVMGGVHNGAHAFAHMVKANGIQTILSHLKGADLSPTVAQALGDLMSRGNGEVAKALRAREEALKSVPLSHSRTGLKGLGGILKTAPAALAATTGNAFHGLNFQ